MPSKMPSKAVSAKVDDDGCLSKEAVQRGVHKWACVKRKKGWRCCQAICSNGNRCQKKAEHKIPLSVFQNVKAIEAVVCQTMGMVQLDQGDCCMLCDTHWKVKKLQFVRFTATKACSFIIDTFFEQIKQSSGINDLPEEQIKLYNWYEEVGKKATESMFG